MPRYAPTEPPAAARPSSTHSGMRHQWIDGFQLVQAVDEKSYDVDDTKCVESHNYLFTFMKKIRFYSVFPC